MRAMSSYVVARVVGGVAASSEVLRGARPAGRLFPGKKALVVMALFALAAFAALIPASQAPNTFHHHSSAGSTADQLGAAPVSQSVAPQMSEEEALDAYAKLPLSFVPNEGQITEEAVRYYAQGAGYGFFFTPEGATLSFANGEGRGHALALDFLGADPDATLEAQKRLAGKVNYLVGDDPAKWQRGLPAHDELLYGALWPGIDMAVRGEEGGKLKYEFHLKPGASVEDVRLAYRGAEGLSVGAGGELLVQTSLGVLMDAAPVSYQLIGGKRVAVESRYKLEGDDGSYGFAVGVYDPRYPLVIDPGLDYSTFLGGTFEQEGDGIAVDRRGRAYVTGDTRSTDFPTTPGAFDRTYNDFSFSLPFVTKFNASGSALVYSTFLGGGGAGSETGNDIVVQDGSAYVTGVTSSANYPTTPNAFDTSFNGGPLNQEFDGFVTKLNASGSALDYSTFLGGTDFDEGNSIAVDGSGRAYVTGFTESADFPTTSGAFDPSFSGLFNDTFVTKLNASGSALDYSTFLGQGGGEGIAVREGKAYVTGSTGVTDFPTTPGAFDTTHNGLADVFVTKLNESGSALVYSTFLGGTSGDLAMAIAVDGRGRAYVSGTTTSTDYSTTPGAFDTAFNGGAFPGDIFVTKLNASGSELAYSTYLGGRGIDSHGFRGDGIAVDGRGRAYVTGLTESGNFPTTPNAFDTTFNGALYFFFEKQDAFVTKLNASGSALSYSTFLGGLGTDRSFSIAVREGNAYVTGDTSSSNFPTTRGAFDTTFNAQSRDAFVTKLPTG